MQYPLLRETTSHSRLLFPTYHSKYPSRETQPLLRDHFLSALRVVFQNWDCCRIIPDEDRRMVRFAFDEFVHAGRPISLWLEYYGQIQH